MTGTPAPALPATAVLTYRSPQDFQRDLPRMVNLGYEPISVSTQAQHVNVGRTLLRVATVAGLLAGVSRSPAYTTVIYKRTAPAPTPAA